LPITIEPGRAIVGNAGILLTKVNFLKSSATSRFCIVDAGMNDLIRPALYQAYQEIVPVSQHTEVKLDRYDVVGPICESGDFLGKDRMLAVAPDDLLAVRTAGAYSAVMASNYNARPRPAEVMVDGDQFHLVRERESLEQLFQGEHSFPV
jgi:diaminopimelate decarboxylase